MANLDLIDWRAVGFGAAWILGLSLILTALGFAREDVLREGLRWRQVLARRKVAGTIDLGLALFSAGMSGSARALWETAVWIVLAAGFGLSALDRLLRPARPAAASGRRGAAENRRVAILRSNPVAPDPRVEKLARAFHSLGMDPIVVAWDREGKASPEDTVPGEVVRLPIRARYGRGLSNLGPLLRWQWGLSKWLAVHQGSLDILHACDFDTLLPALYARARWGVRVVYDVFDSYPDMLRATPAWLISIIRRVDHWGMSRADAVILADEARKEQIRGANPRRLAVIYNTPEDRPELLSVERPTYDKAVLRIVFVGLLQVERGLLELLEVMGRHPEWRLELAGFGGDADLILARARPLENVRFHGRVTYEQALGLMASGDVLVATYDPAIPNHRFASPNKLFEAMMLSKPVIVARGTHMDELAERYECGIAIPYGDTQALERSLQRLADDPETARRLGENGRRAYESSFRWDTMRRVLQDLYASLESPETERRG